MIKSVENPQLRKAAAPLVAISPKPFKQTKMNKIKIAISLLIVGQLLFTSCGGNSNKSDTATTETKVEKQKTLILDLPKVANKTEKEVETILGKAERTEKVKGYPCEKTNCQRAFYSSDKYEIIFKEGKANRITINKTSDYTSDENALENFGLQVEKPTFKNPCLLPKEKPKSKPKEKNGRLRPMV